MTEQPTSGEVLAAIERERADWDTLLGKVGEDRMLEPGPMGEMTFKDLVAHLNAWRTRGLAKIEAVAHDQPEPHDPWPDNLQEDDDVDAINDWIYEQNADRLLTEVLLESREGFARLAAIVSMVPEEALHDPARFPSLEGEALGPAILSGSFFDHLHEEHEPSIEAWLATPVEPTQGGPEVEL